jgi:uncharacterized protein (UPF0332 family)
MRQEFKECLERGKVIRFPQGKRLVNRELNSARSDLDDAKFELGHSRFKWATIQGYYSMYHAARALIYSECYRERSHYCLFVALQELFVDNGTRQNRRHERPFSQPNRSGQIPETEKNARHY